MPRKPVPFRVKSDCPACKGEPDPGYIEMPDNGPIVPCYLCNREEWLQDKRTLKDVYP